MLRKKMKLALVITAVLCAGMVNTAMAEETEAAATEAVQEKTTEKEAEAPKVITVQAEGKEALEIKNTAELNITDVQVEVHEEDELVDIILTDKDDEEYEFVDVPYDDISEPELVVEDEYAYIQYTSLEDDKEESIGQTGERTYEESKELYAIDNVNIRSNPDTESEILGVINVGDSIEVLGDTATHYQVKQGDVTGYASRKYISDDKEKAEKAAKEYAESIAQQSSSQTSSQQTQTYYEEPSAPQQTYEEPAAPEPTYEEPAVYEVRRQRFDDCDGSGHGYFEITYSDGSTAIEEY